ncbi:hypothetical protein DPMN_185222 [Dreissena polymorpha]|uniref:Uncharacterized protein n=1 Tax=Dreissena polymorpha TaxID=45954 RepID=A0A9D4DJA5_DREPO|nr:hypothetical protein DPMN_185222 [Dreissena polymorpha]
MRKDSRKNMFGAKSVSDDCEGMQDAHTEETIRRSSHDLSYKRRPFKSNEEKEAESKVIEDLKARIEQLETLRMKPRTVIKRKDAECYRDILPGNAQQNRTEQETPTVQ